MSLMMAQGREVRVAGGRRPGWVKFMAAAAGSLAVGALNLGVDLAVNAATATSRWPGWLRLILQHPWAATGVLVGISVVCGAISLLLKFGQESKEMLQPESVEVPPLWAVARPETEQVVQAVLAGAPGTVGITTAVHGAGGFGKSTVAQLVCADARVRKRFKGRVYWVTVGLGQDSPARIAEHVAMATLRITGNDRQFPGNPMDAGKHLGSLLAAVGRPLLLVLDDVWEAAQLDPFLQGAANCVRLVTTRVPKALPDHAVRVLVDRLGPQQARAVLTDGLPPLPGPLADALVEACMQWALLLRLANRWIAELSDTDGDAVRHATTLLDRLGAGPRALDQPDAVRDSGNVGSRQVRNRLVETSVQASLSLVLPPSTRERFLELGAFAPDEPIPIRMLIRLWGRRAQMDETAVRQACSGLHRLALVEVIPSGGGAVLLHDVLHAYARQTIGSEQLQRVNRDLDDALEAELPSARDLPGSRVRAAWWEVDEFDGYALDNVIEILVAADEAEQAMALASDIRFIAARIRQRGAIAPIADLDRLAREGIPEGESRAAALTRLAHLLRSGVPGHGAESTLLAYLGPLEEWRTHADALAAQPAEYARLLSVWPVPDLPDPALVRTLGSHISAVRALVWSNDGSWVATGTSRGTVHVWDADTGALIRVLTVHAGKIATMAASPDGTWLVTGDLYGRVRMWDTSNGDLIHSLAYHSGPVRAVVVSPDGAWLVTGDSNRARMWDVATGELIRTLGGCSGRVAAVAVSPDGAWLAAGDDDGAVQVWNASTGAVIRSLIGNVGKVRALAVSPDGAWLVTGDSDGVVRVWDAATGTMIRSQIGHTGEISALAVSPDGAWLISAAGYGDGEVALWEASTGKLIRTLMTQPGGVSAVAVAPDSTMLLTCANENAARMWTIKADPASRMPFGRLGPVYAVAMSPDGTWLATGASDEFVYIWDTGTGRDKKSVRTSHSGGVGALAAAPDGTWLATAGSRDGVAEMWELATGSRLHTLAGNKGSVRGLAVAPDGTWLATFGNGPSGSEVHICDTATGSLVRRIRTDHRYDVTALAVAPDGTWLATGGSHDGTVKLWDVATGDLLRTMNSAVDGVTEIAVALDGTWLALSGIGDNYGQVEVREVATGDLLRTLIGHTGRVFGLAVSPDGARLATASLDRTLRVWNSQGRCEASIAADAYFTSIVWGTTILAAGSDNGLHGYRFEAGRPTTETMIKD